MHFIFKYKMLVYFAAYLLLYLFWTELNCLYNISMVVTCCFADPSALITAGPYGLIFSSFVPFFFDIPVSTRFRVFGFHFSDKSFIYLAGLQVICVFNITWYLFIVWPHCWFSFLPASDS